MDTTEDLTVLVIELDEDEVTHARTDFRFALEGGVSASSNTRR